ncbi:MAG: calcium/sodium antiporter [Planctomycetes bacterium]|nr:calcium/sodium antiporter [Planctomycetota bacterium]
MLAAQEPTWVADYPAWGIAAGLVALVVGADLLVRGAVWIALVLGMSRMAVGLTLVAIGTSLPELLVSLTAARNHSPEIAMSNVLGSNAANTLLIVGAAAAICAIRLEVRWLELIYLLIATALLAVPFVLGTGIEPVIAGVMLAMLVTFCAQLLRRERRAERIDDAQQPVASAAGWVLHLALVFAGFFGLQYGADWLVGGAVVIAARLGMPEGLIGLTIVAVGTSLPELATSVAAALRRQPEICIGNVLGSNIFNVGAVLGIAGLLQPFPIDLAAQWRAMTVTAVSAVALLVVLRVAKGIPRAIGWLFLLLYVAFLTGEVLLAPPS